MNIDIEFEPEHQSDPCECCGEVTTSLTRFVYVDDDARAVYYARYSEGHPERGAHALMSIGEWSEGSEPDGRTAFALELSSGPENYGVRLRDAEESPWFGEEFLGSMLDREGALEHPLREEVFAILDQALQDDAPLRAFLDRAGDPDGTDAISDPASNSD